MVKTLWTKVFAVCAVALLCAVNSADAGFTLNFNDVYTGAKPSGTGSFLTAKFEDGAGSAEGMVLLTLTANLQDPAEFITDLALNFNGAGTLSLFSVTGTGPTPTLSHDPAKTANGWGDFAGKFIFEIQFPTPKGDGSNEKNSKDEAVKDRFQGTEFVQLTLMSTSPIWASDFNVGSTSNVLAAVHVQGIATGDGSGKLAGVIPPPDDEENPPSEIPGVPEPGTLALLALGSIGLGGYRKLRSRKEMAA